MRKQFVYGVYKGDDFLTVGTAIECAAFMGWKKAKHTQFFASPTYRNRVKDDGNGMYVFKLEDDDEEDE